MSERKSTGGTKEFHYSKEDTERIRKTDTSSTRAFKEEYRRWQERRAVERVEEERFKRQRRNMVLLLMILFIMLVILVFFRIRG